MLDEAARNKMMADKLYIEVQHGRIDDDWTENFICDVRSKLSKGQTLTDKQTAKLEELFERY